MKKRTPVIAGNWKMNKTPNETRELLKDIIPQTPKSSCEVVVCVPFTSLAAAAEMTGGTALKLGAQNVHWEEKGAYTGEISAQMLTEIGAGYVLVGHSERRAYFGETDETVNARLKAALNAGLKVILCVGELEAQREAGITEEIVSMQAKQALRGVSEEQMKNVLIAYEPVWAIGTGKTATSAQAQDVCCYLRWVVEELYGSSIASQMKLLYGGSMNASNAAELLAEDDIDGGLIGGASLKAVDFGKIIEAALKPAEKKD